MTLCIVNWIVIGLATQTSPGIYTFIDTNSLAFRHRFYRLAQIVQAPATNLRSLSINPGTGFELQFTGVGNSYTVLGSTNLVLWVPLGPAVSVGKNSWQFIDTGKLSARYYRVRSP